MNERRTRTFSRKKLIISIVLLITSITIFILVNVIDKKLQVDFEHEYSSDIREVYGRITNIKKIKHKSGRRNRVKNTRTEVIGTIYVGGHEENITLSNSNTDTHNIGDIIICYEYDGIYAKSKASLVDMCAPGYKMNFIIHLISLLLAFVSGIYSLCEGINGFKLKKETKVYGNNK